MPGSERLPFDEFCRTLLPTLQATTRAVTWLTKIPVAGAFLFAGCFAVIPLLMIVVILMNAISGTQLTVDGVNMNAGQAFVVFLPYIAGFSAVAVGIFFFVRNLARGQKSEISERLAVVCELEFSTKDGQRVTMTSMVALTPEFGMTRDVRVRYDPADPENAMVPW